MKKQRVTYLDCDNGERTMTAWREVSDGDPDSIDLGPAGFIQHRGWPRGDWEYTEAEKFLVANPSLDWENTKETA